MKAGIRAPSRLCDVLLPLVLLLVLGRLWLMPMRSSFWVDEMGTVFVVQHGPNDPSLAVAPQVPQSIYYLLPRGAAALFGFSEFTYRLPSLLAMGAALFLIARLAARLVDPRAAWFAAFACLALRGIDYQAADARPYGLGTLVACGALWFLVRWLDFDDWRDALGFVLLAALLWRVQLIFWPFYLVFGIYAATRLVGRDSMVTWKRVAVVFAMLGLALLPVLLKALTLYRQAGAHVIVALPSVRDLLLSLKIGLIAVCGGGAWLVRCWWDRRFRLSRPLAGERATTLEAGGAAGATAAEVCGEGAGLVSRAIPNRDRGAGKHRTQAGETGGTACPTTAPVLVLSWWLCQPLCLFGFSWLTGNSVFVARYLWLALPGTALVATWAAARFVPSAYWKPLAAVLGVGALLLNGQWTQAWPWHHNSDWRDAAHKVQELRLDPDTPVICPSPFIEAKPPVWRADYPLPGFLYAHLAVYPLPGKIWPFPFEDSPEAEEDARRLSGQTLGISKRFILYGGQGQVDFWRQWFAGRPELARWSNEQFRTFGDVEVVVFREEWK